MEHIDLSYPASITLPGKALTGVVGSGDMEALFEPAADGTLTVAIKTSVDGSRQRWQHLFERLASLRDLPAGRLEINDFGATPGVARLRIEQVFEEAAHA
ncbi:MULTISPECIES: malonate decarboxylase subunit delta [Serratia]|jgi:malonate decarboxylase delta subunit|uniref:Malonate decarboxylase acyl carrier protein n=1 Tax=Serratia fonticola TaxID=47917 RepID=A0A0F7D108_SERFO|nr:MULTISPECIES: malonate decarboxylase subunit delta [Serratia]ERK11342.1 Malonate decarboxylase delta subunit [Serratia fonticola AU-AP2C]AKG68160.1 malonate decarboxylase subunit delta [Serratia fonticola]ALX96702.1 malonate decarboxylase acyl carrier protein [Serratia fonticola]ATM76948.1 malonate decarboxylase acyl carrier protein [Serratia fonticola]AYM91909.1 malonate decarboxylase subunit delta [Serratia sp. 3ACOL1]